MRLGLVLGFAAALAAATAGGSRPAAPGALISDCEGRIREVAIHYLPAAAPVVARTYREFLGDLPRDVTVHVLCPDDRAFTDLLDRVGPVACRLRAVPVHRPMTTWSRDRWLALAPGTDGGPTTLVSPRVENGDAVWDARAADRESANDVARAIGDGVISRRAGLEFDGGDFAADGETIFVTPEVARRNPFLDRAELTRRLGEALGRRIVLLEDAPEYHAGMFLMPVGNRTVLVGDPSLAEPLCPEDPGMPGGADFSEETQAKFDAVARRCSGEGYRVVRFPVVPGRDLRTWLTGLNAILSERDGRRVVWMPVYRNAPRLNAAAADTWRSVGYEVRPVDCTETFRHAGSLRCLVNVLRRGP